MGAGTFCPVFSSTTSRSPVEVSSKILLFPAIPPDTVKLTTQTSLALAPVSSFGAGVLVGCASFEVVGCTSSEGEHELYKNNEIISIPIFQACFMCLSFLCMRFCNCIELNRYLVLRLTFIFL